MNNLINSVKINLGNNKYIILVRHGESYKNLQDIHGGDVGTELTPEGIKQMKKFANNVIKFANKLGIKKCRLFCSDSQQVRDSMQIIEYELNKTENFESVIGKSYPEEMAPIDLGIAAGKSNEQLKQEDPEAHDAMEKGRRGEIGLYGMYENIQGMENPDEFIKRMQNMLEMAEEGANIYVCKTSQFISLANLLMGWNLKNKFYYEGINPENSDMLCFKYEGEKGKKYEYTLLTRLFPSTLKIVEQLRNLCKRKKHGEKAPGRIQ